MNPVWQYILTGIQALMSFAGLVLLFQIGRTIGAWENWRKWAEEQLKSLGHMVSEQGNKLAELIGRLSK